MSTSYDGYFRSAAGLDLYVKPSGPLDTDSWGDDVIESAGDANEAIGEYRFPGLTQGVAYEVFQQLGGAPDETDLPMGVPSRPDSINYGTLAGTLALNLSRLQQKFQQLPESSVSVTRGTTWQIPLEILADGWERVEVTARRRKSDDQSESLLHVVLTNPGDPADGLQIWLGSTDGFDAADGEIDPGDSESVAVCTIQAATTAAAVPGEFYCWDAKVFAAGDVDPLAKGSLIVEPDVTRTSE